MSLSGSFVGAASSSSPGKFYRLRVDWSATQDVANNTSTINCNFYLEQDSSWSIAIGGRSNSCTIDGTTTGWTSPTVENGGGTTTHIGSCSRTVSHNSDGTKSLSISATYNTAPLTIANTAINSITASANVTLDTIARASTPTVNTSSVAMRDGSVRIYTNRASDSFTHAMYYVCGSASSTIATGVTEYFDWTPPLDLAYQVPSDDEVTVTIYCNTYTDSGTTLVGTKSVSITATVPTNVTPYAEILNRGDATAAYVKLGTYVQNVSHLNLHIGNSGTYGSYVTGVGITLGGKAFSSGALITGSGNLTLRITVTDSRGRSSSDEEIISVAPYKEPKLALTAHRCDEDGTANDAGEYAKITVSGSTTQVNNRNTATCMLTYGGTTVNLGIGVGDFYKELIVEASSEKTMAISATLSDKLKSVPRSMVLSTGYATMDFLAGGRGIAFGTTATKEGFTCAMDTDFAGHKATGLATPTSATDVANKEYVDNQLRNRNLLDNSNFRNPINQREKTEYSGGGYTIDRWCFANSVGVLTINDGYVSLSSGVGYWKQIVEMTPAELGAYTMSLLTNEGELYVTRGTPNHAAGVYLADGSYFYYETASSTLNIKAIKLECGTTQTLARKDSDGSWVLVDPPPNRQQELAKCQRYFIRLTKPNNPYSSFVGMGSASSESNCFCLCPVPVPMRDIPKVSASSCELLNNVVGNFYSISSVSVYGAYANNQVTLTVASSGLVKGNLYYLVCRRNNGYIDLSADL